MKYAQILDNKVYSIIESEYDLPELYNKYYCKDDINLIKINNNQNVKVGWNYESGEFKEPPAIEIDLNTLKNSYLQRMNIAVREAITSGFISTAKGSDFIYDSLDTDQSTLRTLYIASQSPKFNDHPIYKGNIPIRAILKGKTEKVILNHNKEELQQLVDDLALHISTCKQKGWDLQSQIKSATTKEELEKITWA